MKKMVLQILIKFLLEIIPISGKKPDPYHFVLYYFLHNWPPKFDPAICN